MALCLLCRGESEPYFRSRDFNRKISREIFNHYRCSRCEVIFIFPIPVNLSEYYHDKYYFIPESLKDLEIIFAHEQYKIEIVQRFANKGRLLEIGPSCGSFTHMAKKAGFDVEAIEMDARCCQFLNNVVGVRAINSSNAKESIQNERPYDVIALWHVIEHLPNPWEMLEVIAAKLLPGGILIIATPNPDAFQFYLLGKYWPHVDAPRHLVLIPRRLLVQKLESLGLKTELITTRDKGSLGWNIFGWEYFFSNIASWRYLKWGLRLVGRMVSYLFSPIETVEGRGSAYTVVFRKDR